MEGVILISPSLMAQSHLPGLPGASRMLFSCVHQISSVHNLTPKCAGWEQYRDKFMPDTCSAPPANVGKEEGGSRATAAWALAQLF